MKVVALAVLLLAPIVALTFLAFGQPGAQATPGVTVGIDVESGGNTATSLGTIQSTRTIACGDVFDLDIYITEVTSLRVWSLVFHYDPAVVRVIGRDVRMFLGTNPGSSTGDMDLSLGDSSPPGGFYDLLARDVSEDPAAHESGSGVLARIMLEAVGTGSANLALEDAFLFGYPASFIRADSTLGASITVQGPCPTAVDIDVKPGSDRIPVKLSSRGVIPVAILSTSSFDATTVDPGTVCFGDDEDPSQRDCTEAHGTGHIEDLDRDGDLDLVLHYETGQTGIDLADTQACLAGRTFGGMRIRGCDAVRPL
jgi:hypothetical protein